MQIENAENATLTSKHLKEIDRKKCFEFLNKFLGKNTMESL